MTDAPESLDVLSARLQHLMDHEEIRQAMYAYARGVDRLDPALIVAAYHDDAFDHHGGWTATGGAGVAEKIVGRGRVGDVTASMHHIGNILIDLKGDAADVEAYFIAYHRLERDGKTFTRARAGRYLDRFERRDGRWRIARRRVVDDWSRLDEVVATAKEIGPGCLLGTRDFDDPSHDIEHFLDGRKR